MSWCISCRLQYHNINYNNFKHKYNTTAAGYDCAALCVGVEDGLVTGNCCAQEFCYCTSAAAYHVDCPLGTAYCPLMEDCIRDDTCYSHMDQCCF